MSGSIDVEQEVAPNFDTLDTEPNEHLTGGRVLVADDDEDMRWLVKSELTRAGYEVNCAVSGTDFFQVLESITVEAWPSDGLDLLVLDLRMPGLTGIDIIRKLRRDRWLTPIILMTAFAEPDVVLEATRLGIPVLTKPFALGAVRRAAASLLTEHGRSSGEVASHGFSLWG